MDKSDDASSTDINSLANSLRGKVKTLYPLSNRRCIYRVPPDIRIAALYTPKTVSIGPLHHGSEELKAMQEDKLRYLEHFLQLAQASLEEFLILVKDKEEKLRNCYADTIQLASQDFVEMVFLDAVFLIEVLLRFSIPIFRDADVDRIFNPPWLISGVVLDMLSLENQLPLFILEDLLELAKLALPEGYEEFTSLSNLTCKFLSLFARGLLLIEDSLFETHFSEANHFVDLLRICVQPPDDHLPTSNKYDFEATPSITELHRAGVKFKLGSKEHLLDIRFNQGSLEIPQLKIGITTKHLFRNIMIFERLHKKTVYVNNYVKLLNDLINSPKDAELLIQNGIIENHVWGSEGVSSFLQELSRDARRKRLPSYYSGMVKDLKSSSKSPWHKMKTNLKQNYFNTPWTSISVIAAVILLILTFIQAVCAIISL